MTDRLRQVVQNSLVLLACLLVGTNWVRAAPKPTTDLIGVWQAKRNFGPEVQGTLTVTRNNGLWEAEIAGHRLGITSNEGVLEFDIPGGRGRFQGRIDPAESQITGHWIQPPTVNNGAKYASPVALEPDGKDRWRGEVVPLEDEFTFLLLKQSPRIS